MQRLQQQYKTSIAPKLKEELSLKSLFAVPKIEKVVINVGVGKLGRDSKFIDTVVKDLTTITGQRPIVTKARKSIAGFRLREGQQVGVKVTLRGEKMYSFLDRLINVALPRVRDFRGVKATGFDKQGNFHMGLKEHMVFPDLPDDVMEHSFGMEITMVTTSKDPKASRKLLEHFNFPFVKTESK